MFVALGPQDQFLFEIVTEDFADPAVNLVYGDLDYVAATDITRVIRPWRSGDFFPEKLSRVWMPPHLTVFARSSCFVDHGPYDTSYRIAANYDAMLRFFGRAGLRSAYVPEVLVKMRKGGVSNQSLKHIMHKSREDLRALKTNGIGGVGTLTAKNLSKIPQFLKR